MDIKFTVIALIFLAVPSLGRVRRQGTLEDNPVLPFAGQSRPGDESPSLEVQNVNAEKGIIDNKDAEVEEVLEYVDESGPGADPEVELDQTQVDEEPGVDAAVGGEAVARVYGGNGIRRRYFERPVFGYQNINGTTTGKPDEEKPWYKRVWVWIVAAAIIAAIVILLLICCCCKKK